MLNANELRVNRARRQELERAARLQNRATEARPQQRQPKRSSWARIAALFV